MHSRVRSCSSNQNLGSGDSLSGQLALSLKAECIEFESGQIYDEFEFKI